MRTVSDSAAVVTPHIGGEVEARADGDLRRFRSPSIRTCRSSPSVRICSVTRLRGTLQKRGIAAGEHHRDVPAEAAARLASKRTRASGTTWSLGAMARSNSTEVIGRSFLSVR
jgi:hypothetical protein